MRALSTGILYAALALLFPALGIAQQSAANRSETQPKYDYEQQHADFQLKHSNEFQKLFKSRDGSRIEFERDFDVFMSSSGKYATANVHGKLTETALKNFLSRQCINYVINENTAQDNGSAENDSKNHFDNNLICESYEVVRKRRVLIDSTKERRTQMKLFAQILHALQDFYSHSNYVEANLSLNEEQAPEQIKLFDFERYCTTKQNYENIGRIFTAFYEGDHSIKSLGTSVEDFSNPESHLHWNKDVSPYDDPGVARWFSRSSLKRSKKGRGQTYFDFAFSLQVRATIDVYMHVKDRIQNFGQECKL